MAMGIGTALRMLRKRKGWTLKQVADVVGLSIPSLSEWEKDRVKSLDTEKLQAFSDLYQVQVWEIFRIAAGHAADNRRFVLEEPAVSDYLVSDPPDVAELILLIRQMAPAQSSSLLKTLKLFMG